MFFSVHLTLLSSLQVALSPCRDLESKSSSASMNVGGVTIYVVRSNATWASRHLGVTMKNVRSLLSSDILQQMNFKKMFLWTNKALCFLTVWSIHSKVIMSSLLKAWTTSDSESKASSSSLLRVVLEPGLLSELWKSNRKLADTRSWFCSSSSWGYDFCLCLNELKLLNVEFTLKSFHIHGLLFRILSVTYGISL